MWDDDYDDYSSGYSFNWNEALNTGSGLVSSLLGTQSNNQNSISSAGGNTTMLLAIGAVVVIGAVLLFKK